MKNLNNIKNILFDCDGVLYSDLEAVFGQVSRKMTEYISNKLNVDLKKAKELQTNYFHKYNTSLNGLMIHHEIDPKEFLDFVHDIDLSFLEKDTALRLEKFKIDPKETLYIEDIAKNLSIGKERGTITAWLINDEEWGKKESNKEYIDYKIENLTLFLKEIRLLKNQ